MNRNSIPAELGTRMLAAGVAHEIHRATGYLPAPRTNWGWVASAAAWAGLAVFVAIALALGCR